MDNREFWDEQASDYDQLYSSPWWKREDDQVKSCLHRLPLPKTRLPVVLDIGCGTGFLYRQLEACNISTDYVGIDVSPKMLANFKPRGRKFFELVEADVADYKWERPQSPDLITSIYCPLSFSSSRWTNIERLAAAQKPGGILFLMILNRYSLRRLLRREFDSSGRYAPRERGSYEATPANDVDVFYDRPHEVKETVVELGYEVLRLKGDGPLSGVLERPALQPFSAWLGRRSPLLSYSIILIARKT